MPKKNLSVAMAYVGVVAGAGLASGQDLLQYFLSFGVMGVLGIAVMGGLNVVFGSLALQLGSYFRSDHHDEVFGRIAHPVVNRLIDIVLVASSFIMGFVMLAGAGANLQQAFGLPTMWGAVACGLLVVVTAFLDIDRITRVIGVFTPVIVVLILVLTAHTLTQSHPPVEQLDAAARSVVPALPDVWLSALNYCALCVLGGVAMAFVLGGSVLRIDVARSAGRIGGAVLAGVVVLTGITLFLNVGTVKDVDVPMQEIARSIHPAFVFVYTLAIFALIYNTVFSLFYSVARRFSGGSEARMRLILIGVVVAGLAASMAGFKSLVGIMYPILGYLGMALMVVVAMGWWRERHNIGREENLRRKMVRLLLRKHTPRAPYTTEHRRDVRALAEASVADASQLRSDADELAGQIVANEDDVRAFAHANLPVDEDKVAELVGPRSA